MLITQPSSGLFDATSKPKSEPTAQPRVDEARPVSKVSTNQNTSKSDVSSKSGSALVKEKNLFVGDDEDDDDLFAAAAPSKPRASSITKTGYCLYLFYKFICNICFACPIKFSYFLLNLAATNLNAHKSSMLWIRCFGMKFGLR